MKTSIVNAGQDHKRPARAPGTGSPRRFKSNTPSLWVLALVVSTLVAGNSIALPALSESASPGDSWSHLRALPPQARINVAGGRISKVCHFISADDEQLICSSGRRSSAKQFTFARADVRNVKLTRYAESTLAGAGIGAGAGAVVGAAVNSQSKGGLFSFPAAILGITIASGALAGGAIGGPTDFLRGPTIYQRPTVDVPRASAK
jgi:hypothetical protein